jgi:hypothetical protein
MIYFDEFVDVAAVVGVDDVACINFPSYFEAT